MSFRNRMKDPKTTMFFGMAFLALSLNLPYFVHPSAQPGKDWLDGVRGLIMGLSIGLNILSVRLAARRRGCGDS